MAFPTTPVIDSFNRSALGPDWTNDPWGFGVSGVFGISSNALDIVSGNAGYLALNTRTFGQDCEAYVTMRTKPPDNDPIELMARMGTPNGVGANATGYSVQFYPVAAGTDVFQIFRWDQGARNPLGGLITQEVSSGDKIGISCVGSVISAHYYNGTSWSVLGFQVDSTYRRAGYLAVYEEVTGGPMIDFGGGTIPTASDTPPFIHGRGAA